MDKIQQHLKETLEAIFEEQAQLRAQLEELEHKEQGVRALLGTKDPGNGDGEVKSLGQYLQYGLANGVKGTTDQWVHNARKDGLEFKDARSVNAILQGFLTAGWVKCDPSGIWEWAK